MKQNFYMCLSMLLKHEGGFVNHPKDPGGMTNLGVTKKAFEEYKGTEVSEQEMRDLLPTDVTPFYREKYWDKIKGDDLPAGVDWAVFDWCVNSGPSRAARALQVVVNATADGAIGPKTLEKVSEREASEIIKDLHAVRQEFYENLSTFDTFGKGWTRRNKETLEQALEMV